jgi:hypothetical protein
LRFAVEARAIVLHVLQTRSAICVSDLCNSFSDFEEEEIDDFLGQLSVAGLLRPLPQGAVFSSP